MAEAKKPRAKKAADEIAEKFGIVAAAPVKRERPPYSPISIKYMQQRTPEWGQERKGKVTGKKAKGLMGRTKVEWVNLLVGENMSKMYPQEETDLARGNRLEPEAIEYFEKKTGLKVEAVGIIARHDNPRIASSPDGIIWDDKKVSGDGKQGAYAAELEVKCLAVKSHIEAIRAKIACVVNKTPEWDIVPDEHRPQALEYFITNDDQDLLYFVFYSEDILDARMVIATIRRQDIHDEIERAREVIVKSIAEAAQIETEIKDFLFEHGADALLKPSYE